MTRLRWCTVAGLLGLAALAWMFASPTSQSTVAQDVRDPKIPGGGGGGGDGKSPNGPVEWGPGDRTPFPGGGKKPRQRHTFDLVEQVHARNHLKHIRQKGVVGIGIMADPARSGEYAIRVVVTGDPKPMIPAEIEGIPVYEEYTVEYPKPYQSPEYQQFLVRPVPIGISVANENAPFCYSGTLGARIRDVKTGQYFMLSNNHVFGLENDANPGDPILQPSTGDDLCNLNISHRVGTLASFIAIDFSGTNKYDAAIARTTPLQVGVSTLPDGYGTPTRNARAVQIGELVQKYGRTTGFTQGRVTSVNYTVNVLYSGGIATFTGQIRVAGANGYPSLGAPGDSGSLVVDANRNPVGLLFSGGGGNTNLNPIPGLLQYYRSKVDDGGFFEIGGFLPPPGKRGVPVKPPEPPPFP